MLKLSVFMSPTGGHVGGWRHPDAVTDAGFNIERWAELGKLVERGKLDMMFLADGNGVNGIEDPDLLSRNPTVRPVVIEPITLLSTLAMHTKNVGLVATATTTYAEPYSIARHFGSLDWASKGRAGWNVVTTSNSADSMNFGRDEHSEQSERFERAEEFVDVVKGLWDSWADDAFVMDKESGVFLRGDRVRLLNHKGKHFSVRGPLNCARPPQGHPVVVVAGASDAAKELAARTADVIFTVTETKESAQEFYADFKARVVKHGRHPDEVKVFPGASIFVGKTEQDAEDIYKQLQDLIPEQVGIQVLSRIAGLDLTQYPLDGPLPEMPETRGIGSFRAALRRLSDNEGYSIRELYQRVLPARGHIMMKGDPKQVADQMEEWYRDKACDGFNLVAAYLPGALEAIIDLVIPELQGRGLFRKEYEGSTLRENLGLARPADGFPYIAPAA
ncbi:LLM class flavin-dependent oxidoreductase [Croceicoccus ponticola]|uniref:LLM class flavin-dependent oxidoreductase n=1 Tax=Croceicoccus ponticola TaxID=2217664 RepID=A0A437H1Z8_9SPHN|nr:LLM class flavin-dependent oxidoreductase [Croceicoccus ponticola]RVQ69654.1 LLM class flavin-dependent oxidoreductase [Croceicoccus ponticola]